MENNEIEQSGSRINPEKIQNEFTDVVNFCLNRLKMNDHYLIAKKSGPISQRATMFGHKLYGQMMEIMEEMMLDTQGISINNLRSIQEVPNDDNHKTKPAEDVEIIDEGKMVINAVPSEFNLQTPSEPSSDDNDSDYRPEDDVELAPYRDELMSLEFNKNQRMWLPENIHYLVDSINSSREEKLKQIQNLVYKKCLEYKEQNKKVSSKLIRQWAVEIKGKISRDLNFHASLKWLVKFKKTFGITGVSPDLKFSHQSSIINHHHQDNEKIFTNNLPGKSRDDNHEEKIDDVDDEPLSKRIKKMEEKSVINFKQSSINIEKPVKKSTSGWIWLRENPYLYDNPSLVERMKILNPQKTPSWAVKMLQNQRSYTRFRSIYDY